MLMEKQRRTVRACAVQGSPSLATAVVGMVDSIMKGEEPEVNDTESYDNGTGVIPTYLCDPVVVTVDNYKEILIDSGYYTEDQIK